jgi:proline dehydrogenase
VFRVSLESLLRKAIFAVAGNRRVRSIFEIYGMRVGVSRFVAAESLEDTVQRVQSLNGEGLMVTLDFLGESVANKALARQAADMVVLTMKTIRKYGLQANVSVKLTQLGLQIDPYFCLQNMHRITAKAKELGQFVRIDMEDSFVTGETLDIFQILLHKYGKEHIGIVIQSYLYRSEQDLRKLGAQQVNVRIVKGAYKESADVAFQSKKDVDANYMKLVERHMENGCYTAVATHDEKLIRKVKRFVDERKITRDRFEFQMLYGVAGKLQRRLVKEGYRVRIYTPFGKQWYPYFTRRIAERPANLWFVIKSMFRK